MADLTDAGGDGRTPLTPDEQDGLLPVALTRGALDALEAENIAGAITWLAGRRPSPADVLDEAFVRELHRRMFGRVWRWAGRYRRSDKNIGVPWTEVPVGLRAALDDTRFQVAAGMDADEVAVRLGHRVVAVHPFANGNGRHSRLLSDHLAAALGRPPFAWGGAAADPAAARTAYLTALRTADDGDPTALVAFARSS